MSFDPSQKIGIKLLDPGQMDNLFPQAGELRERILIQRRRAEAQDQEQVAQSENHLMHDNIYGIFGGRGSGKTSVLFSLREQLLEEEKEKNRGDIVLPVIMPDIISADCSLLGWVLAMTGDVVERINSDIKRDEPRYDSGVFMRECGVDFFENCRFNEQNSLKTEYESIYRECFSEPRELSDQYSFGDMVSIRAEQSRKQYKLTQKLNRFWNRLLRVKREMLRAGQETPRERKNQDAQAPLIFIMFDDIDLAPERSIELLSASYRFFSNPNVAVFITAAFGTLKRVLQYKMYEKVVGSNYRSLVQGMQWGDAEPEKYPVAEPFKMTQAKASAVEYLNKIVPPSSRYFLEPYVTCEQRLLYRYPGAGSENGLAPSSMPIEDFLLEQMRGFYEAAGHQGAKKGEVPRTFLEGPDGKFLTGYLAIFGEKSRYITNGCFIIMNTLIELVKIKRTELPEEEYNRRVYNALSRLLSVLISSNTREVAEQRTEASQLLVLSHNPWKLYVDYGHLLEIYHAKRLEAEEQIAQKLAELMKDYTDPEFTEELRREKVKEGIVPVKRTVGILFVTLFFVENLITLMIPGHGAVHGYREIADYLNRDTFAPSVRRSRKRHGIKLFREYKTVEDILRSYQHILENPRPFINFDPFHAAQLDAYFDLISPGGESALETALDEDYDWCKSWLSLLFIRQSGLLMVNGSYDLELRAFVNRLLDFQMGDDLKQHLHQNMMDFLLAGDLRSTSKGQLEQVMGSLQSKNPFGEKRYDNLLLEAKTRDLEDLYFDLLSIDEVLLDHFGRVSWTTYLKILAYDRTAGEIGEAERCHDMVGFVEYLIECCDLALISNVFEVRIVSTNLENLCENVETVFQISDRVSMVGGRIYGHLTSWLGKYDDEEPPEEFTLPFAELYEFLRAVNEAQLTLTSAYTKGSVLAAEMQIMEDCPIYAAKGKEKELVDFILRLHLLHHLSRAYFSAQFLLADRAQRREDTRANDALAALYRQVIDNRTVNGRLGTLLDRAKREAVMSYMNILEEKNG